MSDNFGSGLEQKFIVGWSSHILAGKKMGIGMSTGKGLCSLCSGTDIIIVPGAGVHWVRCRLTEAGGKGAPAVLGAKQCAGRGIAAPSE